eukprot:CAMPEP_0181205838 /NCGR_PEP_ID=MMETSP1096-20121128/20695_1 /TAXON_ID=156174 ORGANISM="Chrysochromulina ericina, Strain CCMP281" /NCGR_SAMPLE_ID=MMETSP1096 /ASSEMBLY_ACC=CAM_ASM_000453 /LENGTH=111 /DNA_ID=CAMNT_0023296657 /DNA_START=471 /DNA_END=807 /DNA_ORIENTATION=+
MASQPQSGYPNLKICLPVRPPHPTGAAMASSAAYLLIPLELPWPPVLPPPHPTGAAMASSAAYLLTPLALPVKSAAYLLIPLALPVKSAAYRGLLLTLTDSVLPYTVSSNR